MSEAQILSSHSPDAIGPGRLVLVVAKDDTRVDLKALANRLGAGRFSFGRAALLEAVLGVAPGSVTPLALINDSAAKISVVVDQALIDFAEVNCHPADIIIERDVIIRATAIQVLDIQRCQRSASSQIKRVIAGGEVDNRIVP